MIANPMSKDELRKALGSKILHEMPSDLKTCEHILRSAAAHIFPTTEPCDFVFYASESKRHLSLIHRTACVHSEAVVIKCIVGPMSSVGYGCDLQPWSFVPMNTAVVNRPYNETFKGCLSEFDLHGIRDYLST